MPKSFEQIFTMKDNETIEKFFSILASDNYEELLGQFRINEVS